MGYGIKITVSGDYACFTRPEMKVERVSYDVPTPGAIEGMLKSIYWKPAIRYVIDKIIVYNPIMFINVRRNEVKERASLAKIKRRIKGKGGEVEIYMSNIKVINQRAGMILKDVFYGIEFHFELTGLQSENDDEGADKHYSILLRRLQKGQCFKQPVLGCREFSVREIKLVDEFPKRDIPDELKGDIDLGFMLYHMKFSDGGIPKNNDWEKKLFSDAADPVFYRPHMIDGVIDVAKYREMIIC